MDILKNYAMAIFSFRYSFLFIIGEKQRLVKFMRFTEIIKSFIWIIFLLSIIFVIYQVLLFVFGGSWDKEDLILSGIGMLITCLFTLVALMFSQSRTLGKLEERTRNFEIRFISLENRLSNIETEIKEIKNRLLKIEHKLKI